MGFRLQQSQEGCRQKLSARASTHQALVLEEGRQHAERDLLVHRKPTDSSTTTIAAAAAAAALISWGPQQSVQKGRADSVANLSEFAATGGSGRRTAAVSSYALRPSESRDVLGHHH